MVAELIPQGEEVDFGTLANNGNAVGSLQTALSRSEKNLETIPGLLARVIRGGLWRHFIIGEDQFHFASEAEFRRFIEGPRPKGCETAIETVRRIVKGTDAEEAFEDAIRGQRGGANNADPNQEAITGRFAPTVNRDYMTVDGAPTAVPLRVRDYTREAPTGTSTSYGIRQLRDKRPDLLERVMAGELSVNKALVDAGLRSHKMLVPSSIDGLASYLTRNWDPERLARLVQLLAPAILSTEEDRPR